MPRDGRFIEQVGTFNPSAKENKINLDLSRVDHWLGEGAQPSERAGDLIKTYKAAAAPVEA